MQASVTATALARSWRPPGCRAFEIIEARGQGLEVIFANAGGGEFAPLGILKPSATEISDTKLRQRNGDRLWPG
jgi:hypothetical protein